MISLDSTKIFIPKDFILPDLTYFDKQIVTESDRVVDPLRTGGRVSYSLPKSILPYGVKSLQLREAGWILELSAKVLKEDYLVGINLNTIERVFEILRDLKNLNVLVYDSKNIIQNSHVYKCDCTETIDLDKDTLIETLYAIRLLYLNRKFYCYEYKNTLELRHSGKVKERLILYDKVLELSKSKDQIMRQVNEKLNDSRDYLRIETNLVSFKDIREKFNLKKSQNLVYEQSPKLIDILNSKENVTLNIFDKIMYQSKQKEFNPSRHDLEKHEKLKDLIKISKSLYADELLMKYDLDLSRILIHLERELGLSRTNVYRFMKIVENNKNEIIISQSKKNDKNLIDLINIVRDKLEKVA